MSDRIANHRKFPLRNLDISVRWIVDSSLCGCVYGERGEYTIWISVSDDEVEIKNTIAHELAHIHAYVYFRKTRGDKVFFSHGKLHKDIEKYYEENWSKEIDRLYAELEHAEVDVAYCSVSEVQAIINEAIKHKKPKFETVIVRENLYDKHISG